MMEPRMKPTQSKADVIKKKNESTTGTIGYHTFPGAHAHHFSMHLYARLLLTNLASVFANPSAMSELLVCSETGQGSLNHVQQHRSRLTVCPGKMQMSVSAAAHRDFAFSSSPFYNYATLTDSGYTNVQFFFNAYSGQAQISLTSKALQARSPSESKRS
ncbi:hypothetical protein Q8A67_004030 [Cirrhinus molitorella]|uniref:Uncharacterized protein n=1 Tax=Cirrhinus molitorella TaxID=172907 RepID=A0AA88TYE8_9TELE|nr:hypothetical protein Q8A67_004030 [Cirrhinus molitorella]